MKRPIKVLIFSVSIGAGHDSVAEAMAERLLAESPGSKVKIIDTIRYINGLLNKVVVGSYMETLRFTPRVWGYLYERVEQGERLIEFSQLLAKLLSTKICQLIAEFTPDVIITTHAFSTNLLGEMKCQGKVKPLLVSFVTDFHIHRVWISKGIDLYFIHSPDIATPLIQAGIKHEQIKPVGIPIRMQFAAHWGAQDLRKRFTTSGNPVVMVMGGGLGLGRMKTITKELLSHEQFAIVVVAGKNKRLYKRLEKRQDSQLHLFGYEKNIAEIIAACDLIVSKPGGVTSAEILALGKPLIIYAALPGQENRNATYLLEHNAAMKVKELAVLNKELMELWQNQERLELMREKARILGSPLASKLAWREIWAYWD